MSLALSIKDGDDDRTLRIRQIEAMERLSDELAEANRLQRVALESVSLIHPEREYEVEEILNLVDPSLLEDDDFNY